MEHGPPALLRLPVMHTQLLGLSVHLLQEGSAITSRRARLQDQRFAKWMVALDEILVARMKPLKEAHGRDPIKLTPWTAIARGAGQHEVPDAIHVARQECREHMWEEVIDIGEISVTWNDGDRRKAVETVPLLVAVQSVPA